MYAKRELVDLRRLNTLYLEILLVLAAPIVGLSGMFLVLRTLEDVIQRIVHWIHRYDTDFIHDFRCGAIEGAFNYTWPLIRVRVSGKGIEISGGIERSLDFSEISDIRLEHRTGLWRHISIYADGKWAAALYCFRAKATLKKLRAEWIDRTRV